jgi:hypothetical protein
MESSLNDVFTNVRCTRQVSLVRNMCIAVPASATFVELEASIREYDPSVFDADEDLGTAVFSVPVAANKITKMEFTQGNASSGTIKHFITLEYKEHYDIVHPLL